jgi:glycosyltransferase involved in cell wall biosynthesis
MKIAHVIPELVKGGAEQVVVNLANEGIQAGHDVSIILARSADPRLLKWKLDSRVRVHVVSMDGSRSGYGAIPPWVWNNRHLLHDFDVIHCHLTFGAIFGVALKAIGNFNSSRRPVIVYTVHAVGMPIPAWKRVIGEQLSRRFDAIALIASDPSWRKRMTERPRRPIVVIPNGIVPFAASLGTSDVVQAEAYTIGTLGRLVNERKPDMLLRAMAAAARTMGPKLHILIGGAGPEQANLEKLAGDLGVASQVEFAGLVRDPKPFLSRLDLYLSVNVGPHTGIAGMEAASLGCPVIALQAGSDYARQPGDWIWSTADPEELGAAAADLLNDGAARQAFRARQHRYVLENHSAANMQKEYEALYRAALSSRS